MKRVLQIKCNGWTSSPKMPFILSGNSVCMHTPSYSLILGMLGCCMGRYIKADEVEIGFHYQYDAVSKDTETRHRLQNKQNQIKPHAKGTDAYVREFHSLPKLTIWLNRLDWKEQLQNPIGTPSLGASQDLLNIQEVKEVEVVEIEKAKVSGTMIPFEIGEKAGGQLVQLAESFEEIGDFGEGRKAVNSKIFISIPHDGLAELRTKNLFEVVDTQQQFYLHKFGQ